MAAKSKMLQTKVTIGVVSHEVKGTVADGESETKQLELFLKTCLEKLNEERMSELGHTFPT